MSDSTSLLDLIVSAQANKETTANELFDALSPASSLGKRNSTSSGLTWGGYGISRWYVNATETTKANWTQAITGSATRYLSASRAFALTEQASAFKTTDLPLYKIVTSASAVTSYEDHRDPHHIVRFLHGRISKAMGDANVTLTAVESFADVIECTGTNTGMRDLIVPAVPRMYCVYANITSGSPMVGLRVISTSGTGIVIADGMRACVEFDGTNVVRWTPDT